MTEREAIILLTGALYTNLNHKAREALNLAIKALEKQIAKKPIHAHGNYYCPTCKDTWLLWDDAIPNEDDNFCRYCGQKIDWSEEE